MEKSGVTFEVLDPDYEVDKSKRCKHDLGNIDTCGQRREGFMFPFCKIGDSGENYCSQVNISLKSSIP